MKTDELRISQDPRSVADALDKIELIALYTGMPRREASSMRLLAEEMLSATKNILDAYDGRLWMETDDADFTLHLRVAKPAETADREKLIALSKKGEATPPKGLFARLASALEHFMLPADGDINSSMYMDSTMFADVLYEAGPMYTYRYLPLGGMPMPKTQEKKKPEDELAGIEKSIIDAIVDDILVTVQNGSVEIIAVKKLKAEKGQNV